MDSKIWMDCELTQTHFGLEIIKDFDLPF